MDTTVGQHLKNTIIGEDRIQRDILSRPDHVALAIPVDNIQGTAIYIDKTARINSHGAGTSGH